MHGADRICIGFTGKNVYYTIYIAMENDKGTTINDLGEGPEEIERKKSRRPFSRKNPQKAFPQKKINPF